MNLSGQESLESDAKTVSNNLLRFFAQKLSRKEYLDSVTKEIAEWTRCRCVGIRILDAQGYIPYESCRGFDRQFLEKENWLSVNDDACACIRVIRGEFDLSDQSAKTPNGSFYCENSTRFIAGLTKDQKALFRGTCLEAGFKTICIIPIRYRDEILGAIHLVDPREGAVPRSAVETIESMALMTGEAVFRYQLEKALKESENRYRTLVENSPSGIYLVQDGKILFANEAFANIHGYSVDEMIGIDSLNTVHPAERHLVEEIRQRRLRSEECPREYEVRGVKKNGDTIWVQRRNVLIEYNGKPSILGYEIDIDERKKNEFILHENHELLETIFSNVHFLVAYMDRDFNFIRVNRAYAEADDRSPEFYIGKNHFALYPNAENEKIFRNVVETGQPFFVYGKPFEYPLNPERGTTYWDWSLQPIKDKTDRINGVVLSLVNVTHRKRAEEALKASEKELRFLSARLLSAQEEERKKISHDLHDTIGHSLVAIKMLAENSMGHFDQNTPEHQSLKNILSIAQEALKETRTIIADLRPSLIDHLGLLVAISSLCDHFSKDSSIQIEKKHNLSEGDIPESLKMVIYRILQEALNNIIKHSRADRVQVFLNKRNGSLELSIEDNGTGFDTNEALSRNELDRGVGLASMKERTESSGGTFSINSRIGMGTKIRALWPLKRGNGVRPELLTMA